MKKKLNIFTALIFLSKYLVLYRGNFLRFFFGFIFIDIAAIATPILFGTMVDEIIYYQNTDTFIAIATVFVTLIAMASFMHFLVYAQHHYLINMCSFNVKMDYFDHMQKADAQYMQDASTGDIIQTLIWYMDECIHLVVRNVIHFSRCVLAIITAGVYLLLINWKIGLFALVIAPVSVFISAKFGKKIRDYGDAQREYYGGYISWVFEILSALRDIRTLGARPKTEKRFEGDHRKMFSLNIKSGISSLTAGNIIAFSSLCVQLIIFAFAGYAAASGGITVGLLTIVVAFYGQITSAVGGASQFYLDAQNRVSYIQRIYDIMNSPSEDERDGKNELKVTKGEITFRDVSFAYNKGGAVLDSLSLNIGSGVRFALAGMSGSGKTTLAYMLIGFYSPQGGYIEIDGQKLSDCSLKSIREQIGLIQQDVLIFDGTIRANIMLGKRRASDAEVAAACRQAGLWEFIQSLPDGLDTVVGTNGAGLSGGQKQRISIARIYLRNPKIIIFDEATSSLDSETEEAIHEAWKSVLSGRTSIVIAHRRSAVMLCDKAALLEGGRIREQGEPEELERDSGLFKTLFTVKEGGADAQ